MKNLIFKELLMLSGSQKLARRIQFDPATTVIVGDNQTGKSQILKCLYFCFGANASVREHLWEAAELKLLLRFAVEGRDYLIMRDGDSFTLFNESNVVLGVYRSVRELAARLVQLFDFRLQFYSRTDSARAPHPAYLFAPFYVDQDKGWTAPWASFAKLSASRRLDALEYHVGIRPNAYYEAKAQFQSFQNQMVEPELRRKTLQKILDDIQSRMGEATFSTDTADFAQELEQLLAACRRLQVREDEFREKLVALENDRLMIQSQQVVMSKAATELRKDYEFAFTLDANEIECPTCGANYENQIVDKFLIAQDEDRCTDLLVRLEGTDRRIDEEIVAEQNRYAAVQSELGEINATLAAKRDEITLRDVIQAEGKRELRGNISDDIRGVDAEISTVQLQIADARRTMRDATDRKRRREIIDDYKKFLEVFAIQLQVSPLPEEMSRRIAPKIAAGSSDFPRRLMAYYMALLHTIRRHTTSTYCPLVVDTVNQQDQSPENLRRMYGMLATGLPEGTQLILGCVNTSAVTFGGKIIELDEKHGLLKVSEYEDVVQTIRPLIDLRLKYELSDQGEASEQGTSGE